MSREVSSEEDVLTLAEAMQEYPEEWLAMRVTGRDSNGQPTEGVVVGHDRDKRLLRTNTNKERDLCIFYAGQSAVWVMI